MKIRELHVEHYGIYSARQFRFGEGLQVIYGPNEAGKSTLLQLVRELLFGFPDGTPYAFEEHAGKIAATATLAMQDGRCLRFRRQKGRKNTVTGEIDGSREIVDESRLSELLGSANGKLYEHVFGFSLKELAAGEDGLKSANLSEALYGGGIGGLANFQQVQQTLQNEHADLFKPRGKNPEINRVLKRIREQTQALRDVAVKPRQYTELLNQHEEYDAEVARLRTDREELRRRASRLERLEQAFDPWTRCLAAKEQLTRLPSCDGFPADGVEELQRLKEKLITIEEALQDLEAKQRKPAETVALPESAPQLIDVEGTIRTLYQDVGRMRSFLTDMPLRVQECESLKQEIRTRLRELNPEWTLADLQDYQCSLAQRETVQQLAAEQQILQQRGERLAERRTELNRQVELIRNRLSELNETHSPAALEDLVERAQEHLSRREKIAELQQTIAAIDHEATELARKLHAVAELPEDDRLELLPLPLPETVREFVSRLQELSQRVRQNAERVDERNTELAQLEFAQQQSDIEKTVITRDQLLDLRTQRDETWQRIRRSHLEKSTPVEASPLPDEYERRVAETDRLADDRQANAQEVARREQLAVQIARQKQQVLNAEEVWQSSQTEWAVAESEWRALWRVCEIVPLSPAAMLDWLSLHNDHAKLLRGRRDHSAQQTSLLGAVQRFDSELMHGLPTPWNSADASLAEARRLLTVVREATGERQRLKADLPERENALREVDLELTQLSGQRADWQNRWQVTLDEAGFPANWPVGTAVRILTELAELRQKHGEAISLEKRIADMQSDYEAFSAQVAELCCRIADDLISHPPPDAVLELLERIDAARQALLQQALQSQEAAELQHLLAVRHKQQNDMKAAIADLFQRAGVEREEEFTAAAASVQQRTDLQKDIRGHDQNIRAIRGNDDEQTFLAELQQTDVDQLDHDRKDLLGQIDLVERGYQTSLQNAGIARKKIEELDGECRSLLVAAELESSRSELSAAVDRWATLVLAESLMQRALQRFERDHQPRMLNEVSRLLKTMTGGRYVRLQRRLDERGTLLVEQSTGEMKTPSQLSTGTREQLYLAIRLAFVLHYCGESEPLPLVMDDVLVNFDAQRARHTVDVLLEVSQTAQILFLTCHRHVVELFQRRLPACEPLELIPSGLQALSRQPADGAEESDRPETPSMKTGRPHIKPPSPQPELFPQ